MMKKLRTNIYPLFIITAAILWAVDGIIRRSLFTISPLIIVFYEHLIGSLIIAPFVLSNLKKEKATLYSLGVLSLVSILSGLLGTLWFTTALVKVNFISFSVVFLIQKLQPIFATSTAVIFLKEKITKRYMIWAGLALVTAFFVTFKNGFVDFNTGSGTVMAALYAFGAAVAWGSSTTFSKLLLNSHSTSFTTAMRFFMTTVFAFIAVIFSQQMPVITAVNAGQILRFVFIALSTGMVALYIYYKGLQHVEAKVSTILELVFPMLAILIDAFMYQSFLAPTQLIAAACLLFAIFKMTQLVPSETK